MISIFGLDRKKLLKKLKETNWEKSFQDFSNKVIPIIEKNRLKRIKSTEKSKRHILK